MKAFCKKLSDICKLIFGYVLLLTLSVGGLTFFGYVAALIIGGDTAAAICHFIYKTIVPVMIYVTSATVLFGLLAMYLSGETALTTDAGKQNSGKQRK